MDSKFFKISFSRFLVVFSLFVLAVMFSASPAGAVTINEFPLPNFDSQPMSITAGPDGNLWFTEGTSAGDKIGRITTDGIITEFPVSGSIPLNPNVITAGPDGNLWFTEGTSTGGDKIGRITTDGVISEFPVSGYPLAITAGPDGNLWFTDMAGKIGKITTDGTITEFPVPGATFLDGITAGPDGNLWFTNTGINQEIGRITPSGVITMFPMPTPESFPVEITAGPDGNLWFTEGLTADKIGRITTDGIITEFPLPTGTEAEDITAGSDGNLWFTEGFAAKIGRITTDGLITEFPVPGALAALGGITAGPDGNLWFADQGKIGQVVPDKNPIVTPVPTAATTFTTVYADPDTFYGPTDRTSRNTDPTRAVPLWVWGPDGTIHVSLNLGDYANPVDVYVGIEIPSFSTDIYTFDQNGGLHSLSTEGPVKYRSAVTSVKGDILTLTSGEMSQLKKAYPDPWNFYVLVVPAGNIDNGILDSYYLWEMTY